MMGGYVHTMSHIQRPKDNLPKTVLFFYHVAFGIKLPGLGSQHLCLLCHLAGSSIFLTKVLGSKASPFVSELST